MHEEPSVLSTLVFSHIVRTVDGATGEPFFTPDTVDRLQAILEQQMGEREHDEWLQFSLQNFARAYGDDEPDYSPQDIKHPPPPDERPADRNNE